jgi:hypothetical protein
MNKDASSVKNSHKRRQLTKILMFFFVFVCNCLAIWLG